MIMETIETLTQKLEAAKRHKAEMDKQSPPINTGFVFDLTNPVIDAHFLLGVAVKTGVAKNMPATAMADFIDEATKGAYMQCPAVCQKWFGFIYITEEDKEVEK